MKKIFLVVTVILLTLTTSAQQPADRRYNTSPLSSVPIDSSILYKTSEDTKTEIYILVAKMIGVFMLLLVVFDPRKRKIQENV